MKHVNIKFDREANALYISVMKETVKKTLVVDDDVNIDVDGMNRAVGVEVLNVQSVEVEKSQ